MKRCTKCFIELPLDSFYEDKRDSVGRRLAQCKSCTNRRTSKKLADKRAERKAAGTCTVCGIEAGGFAYCASHRAKERVRHRRAVAANLCTRNCGQPPEPGTTKCRECHDKDKWYNIQKNYGLSRKQYEAMWTAQEGKCPITGVDLITHKYKANGPDLNRSAVVDHCHVSQQPRDILSHRANILLGLFSEDPEEIRRISEAMIAYVQKWAKLKAA